MAQREVRRGLRCRGGGLRFGASSEGAVGVLLVGGQQRGHIVGGEHLL